MEKKVAQIFKLNWEPCGQKAEILSTAPTTPAHLAEDLVSCLLGFAAIPLLLLCLSFVRVLEACPCVEASVLNSSAGSVSLCRGFCSELTGFHLQGNLGAHPILERCIRAVSGSSYSIL